MGVVIVATGLGALVLWAIVSYNRFISQRQVIDNSWANVETELRRRHDLIPGLVATVKGYAAHESETFDEVTRARAGAAGLHGGPTEQTAPEQAVTAGLGHLLAVAEDYPDLQASEQFLELQQALVTTEDRIQAARRLFNGNVRDYNRRVESIPSLVIAALARFRRADYFEIEPSAAAVPSARSTD